MTYKQYLCFWENETWLIENSNYQEDLEMVEFPCSSSRPIWNGGNKGHPPKKRKKSKTWFTKSIKVCTFFVRLPTKPSSEPSVPSPLSWMGRVLAFLRNLFVNVYSFVFVCLHKFFSRFFLFPGWSISFSLYTLKAWKALMCVHAHQESYCPLLSWIFCNFLNLFRQKCLLCRTC